MHAAFINETGAPEVIQYGELPTPEPGAGQVLVKVAAVSVNPIDTYIRSGVVDIGPAFPYVVGCDLAGTVEQVGPGATKFQVGDRVWGSNQSLFGRQGSFAEYSAVEERWLYPTPEGFSESSVQPKEAFFDADLGEFLLPYDAVQRAADPDKALLSFLQSTYESAANNAGWDRKNLERDPVPPGT